MSRYGGAPCSKNTRMSAGLDQWAAWPQGAAHPRMRFQSSSCTPRGAEAQAEACGADETHRGHQRRVEPRGQDDGDAPPFPSAPTAGWAGQADARVAPRRPGEGRGCRPRRRRAPRDPDAFHHRPKVDGCSAGAAGRAAARGMPSTSTGTLHDDDLSWLTRVRRIVASSSRSGSAATCARR